MKHKVLTYACMVGFLVGNSVFASEGDVAASKKLEDRGEFALAAEMLVENLKEGYSYQNCQLLIDFNQRVLAKLSPEITKTTPTLFVPPEKDGFWKRNKSGWKTTVCTLVIDIGMMGFVANQVWLNKKATDAQRAAVKNLKNDLPNLEKVQLVLENYDIVKSVIVYLEKTLKAEIKKNPDTMDSTLSQLQIVREQKNLLKGNRTKYLSYVVISPYLWEAERQIFLADNDYLALKFRDKENLDDAVHFLAKACHKEWLYQSSEDVRQQFESAQRALKQVASKTELDDYKVVTTLADSLDPSKKRGEDAWME